MEYVLRGFRAPVGLELLVWHCAKYFSPGQCSSALRVTETYQKILRYRYGTQLNRETNY